MFLNYIKGKCRKFLVFLDVSLDHSIFPKKSVSRFVGSLCPAWNLLSDSRGVDGFPLEPPAVALHCCCFGPHLPVW